MRNLSGDEWFAVITHEGCRALTAETRNLGSLAQTLVSWAYGRNVADATLTFIAGPAREFLLRPRHRQTSVAYHILPGGKWLRPGRHLMMAAHSYRYRISRTAAVPSP